MIKRNKMLFVFPPCNTFLPDQFFSDGSFMSETQNLYHCQQTEGLKHVKGSEQLVAASRGTERRKMELRSESVKWKQRNFHFDIVHCVLWLFHSLEYIYAESLFDKSDRGVEKREREKQQRSLN